MNTKTGTLFALVAAIASVAALAPAYAVHSDNPVVDIPDGVGACIDDTIECFAPNTITISPGTTVTWTNNDTLGPVHTIASGTFRDAENVGKFFESSVLGPGTEFTHTFDEPGEYPYFCTLHPVNMAGTVIVEEAHAESDDHHGDDDKMMMEGDDRHDDKMMMKDSMMRMDDSMMINQTIDGEVMVSIKPLNEVTAGSPLKLAVQFSNADGSEIGHVNYNIDVMQGDTNVASMQEKHTHTGTDEIETSSLATSELVDVSITFLGIGLPGEELTGPVGEMVEFKSVPEFGTIAAMILVAAIVSIVVVSARSSIFPRI